MRELDVESLLPVGALDREWTPTGALVYRRSPRWARPQIVDPAMELALQMPAGVRFEFATSATCLELDVMLTTIEVEGLAPPSVMFDVVTGGQLRRSVPAEVGTRILAAADGSLQLVAGSGTTVRIDHLPGDERVPVEIWLPHNAVVHVFAARIDSDRGVRRVDRERRRWVHHGSSISHCTEALSPTQTWPSLVALAADVDLLNLAFAGQCVLDPHIARTIRDLDADLITIKIGINIAGGDLMRERVFIPAMHGFLDTIREGHPRTPILVATPIYSPELEGSPGPLSLGSDGRYYAVERPAHLSIGALTLRRIRELLAQIVDSRRSNGDVNTSVLDGLALFGPDDADDLPDALHPSPAGYRRIAERFRGLVFAGGNV